MLMDGLLVGRLVQHGRRENVLQNLRKLGQVHARETATGRHGLCDPADEKKAQSQKKILVLIELTK